MSKQKNKKPGHVVLTIILVICIIIFCISAWQLYKIFSNYHKSDTEYKQIQTDVTSETDDSFSVDFEKLQKQNPDCIGWIRFEHLDISYPIMQGNDNDYYLHRTFEKTNLAAGSIFMDYQNASDFSDMNTFIFGHNMKNDSMFGLLGDFKDESTYKENPYFWIYTPKAAYRYDIFSCYVADADTDTYTIYHGESEDYTAYIQKLKNNSAYPIDVDVDGSDKIITLSTCTASGYDYRYIVNGVLAETVNY
ncbi:Sortase (surface protein transpeptidase) [uncultured Roseburia sp.]|uniref:Class B sortase n=1 Tax=Brotonthovivens ammoniilytica TaxID=2981725 RepID=A0ABT2TML8_9FIRM|nr:class B sortase [Brotonthovivens ammoniilytica]MCU6763031.1 class B sortase [Brotonthovivens ammoniilytica]SCJ01049.1 Sortase (surface protein transpeptidase) [uncultured Roseburia sp.]